MTSETMMEGLPIPTLGRAVRLLRDLGFVPVPAKTGVLAFEHVDSGAKFLFRERSLDTLTSIPELVNLRFQLTYRDFLTREEFNRFLTENPLPTTAPQ